MLRLGRQRFEELVAEALDLMLALIGHWLVFHSFVVVEDEPSEEDLLSVGLDPDEDTLLGLYQGVSLSERGDGYGGVLPDRIVIYRMPLLEACGSPAR